MHVHVQDLSGWPGCTPGDDAQRKNRTRSGNTDFGDPFRAGEP